jgi:hypothetical protein
MDVRRRRGTAMQPERRRQRPTNPPLDHRPTPQAPVGWSYPQDSGCASSDTDFSAGTPQKCITPPLPRHREYFANYGGSQRCSESVDADGVERSPDRHSCDLIRRRNRRYLA